MKQFSTNYYNTLITIAADSKTHKGLIPPNKSDKPTIAGYQYDLLYKNPFKYTSDDILFTVYAHRNDILEKDYDMARLTFFAKGQACMRASPLTKSYGWGIYANANGQIELVDASSGRYEALLEDETVHKVPAMKSKR